MSGNGSGSLLRTFHPKPAHGTAGTQQHAEQQQEHGKALAYGFHEQVRGERLNSDPARKQRQGRTDPCQERAFMAKVKRGSDSMPLGSSASAIFPRDEGGGVPDGLPPDAPGVLLAFTACGAFASVILEGARLDDNYGRLTRCQRFQLRLPEFYDLWPKGVRH